MNIRRRRSETMKQDIGYCEGTETYKGFRKMILLF